ncbi:MAG: hypothetical protein ABF379_10105 [Akkermansiaceae bacterium]
MKRLIPTLTLSAILVSSLCAQERDRDQRPARGKADQPKTQKVDWDRLKERIEGAVDRGDMTREQADQKYAELKKKISAESQSKRDQPLRMKPENYRQIPGQTRRPDALTRVLGELIAQKKINRDDARKIFEAANSNRAQLPSRQDRPDTNGRDAGQLRDILNQAKKELAEIQEAHRRMSEAHRDHEHHRHEQAERQELRERENVERMERAREDQERAEIMRKQAQKEQEARLAQRRQQELEDSKRKLEEETEMLEKQRRQLQEARKEIEKQQREKKRKTKEEN